MDSDGKGIDSQVDRLSTSPCTQCGAEMDVSGLEPFLKINCPACGSAQTVPARLGPFLLLDLLGAGGMGGVYYGKDEALGRFVAIKVMLKSLGENQEFVETFKREAQAAAQLNHPHVAQIYSFGQEKGQPYIVMELVSGKGLDKLMAAGEPLDQAQVMKIGLGVADGLMAAAEVGLLHGDVKPENILLDEKNQAKLVDFGIATVANRGIVDGIWGTPYYIAPEKIRRQTPDARADMFSLGATLYHALTGRPPFEGETPMEVVKARLEHPPAPLREGRPDLDPRVEKVIMRLLESDPDRRYPAYAALLADMNEAIHALESPPEEKGPVAKGPKGRTLVIKKKKGGATAAAAPAPPPAPSEETQPASEPEAKPPKSGKFVIKKGGAAAPAPSPAAGPTAAAAVVPEPAKKKGKAKKIILVTLLLLLIGGLIGGGVFLGIYLKQKKARETAVRHESAKLATAIKKAKEACEQIELTATNTVVLAAKSQGLIAQATNIIFVALGEGLDIPALKLEPPPLPEGAIKEEAAPTDAAAAAPATNAAPAAASNAPPPAAGATNAVSSAAATNAAATAPLAPEMAAALGSNAAPAQAAAPANPPPAAAAPVPETPPAEVQPPVPEPEIKKLARKVVQEAQTVQTKAYEAGFVAEVSGEVRDRAVKSKHSKEAAAEVKVLADLLTSVNSLHAEAQTAMRNAQSALEGVDSMKGAMIREREAKRKVEEEEAKRKAEDEEKQRQKDAKDALIKSERDSAEGARVNGQLLVKQHKYQEAADSVKAQMASLQTPEGKEAFQIVIDRYTRLQGLKAFVIERINAQPYKWGWGAGGMAQDVVSATPFRIKITTGFVKWEDVSTAQMFKLVEHYLADRSLPYKVQGEQNLAAAIFCFENGAREYGKRFSEKAVEFMPSLAGQVTRLIPKEDADAATSAAPPAVPQ